MLSENGKREIYGNWGELCDIALMRILLTLLSVVLITLTSLNVSSAQSSIDHAVLLSMERDSGQFIITWPRDTTPTTYFVRYRLLTTDAWTAYDTLTSESENLSIIPSNEAYVEYEVEKRTIGADGKPINAFGYYLGHGTTDLARWQRPGRVLLAIDAEANDALATELATWTDGVQREGWIVQTLVVPSSATLDVPFLQRKIAEAYGETSSGAPLTHVMLVGRVPYAYSGAYTLAGPIVQPDGHEEHGGAWSSDARYADIETSPGISSDEQWTDESADITDAKRAQRVQNKNAPGDGKYDQGQIPTDVELSIGRIDLGNLPTFGTTSDSRTREFELLKQYFNRVHAYRTKAMRLEKTARIDDNFGVFTSEHNQVRLVEAFAAGAWRGFSPIAGSAGVMSGEFLDTIPTLLAYGCGGGGYDHCDGIANTSEFAARPIHSAFVWLFGSYFADTDSEDNIMRAALANSGNVLTCGWSGRPHWVIHPLAAMHTIGEVTRASINNAGTYHSASIYSKSTGEASDYAYGQRGIHINLLGDPTLRMPAPAMTGTLSITEADGDSTRLEWDGISDALSYVIEVGKSLSVPLTITSTTRTTSPTSRVSAVLVLPPGSRYVRVRPLFETLTESSFTPILGRGLIGVRDVSSVLSEGAARQAAHYSNGRIVIEGATCAPTKAAIYDLQGRDVCALDFTCNGADLSAELPCSLSRGVYFVRIFDVVPSYLPLKSSAPLRICIQ